MLSKVFVIFLLFSAPVSAQNPPQLSNPDRMRLAEAFRLAEALGDSIWPGWSQAPFAALLVTPEYEFLLRHPNPSQDFTFANYDSLLQSQVYFRQRIFQTDFLATFPAVNGMPTIVIGQRENTAAKNSTSWAITLLHEHFHQLQMSQPNYFAEVNALGLARSDETGMWMLNFPFPYDSIAVQRQFAVMMHTLVAALESVKTKKFSNRLVKYREARQRFRHLLSEDDFKYFSFQLWQEGVCRYTEYRLARLAAQKYKPSPAFASLHDFVLFEKEAETIFERIIMELKDGSLANDRRGIFYAMGAAEALLLDAAKPDWRQRYFIEKFSVFK